MLTKSFTLPTNFEATYWVPRNINLNFEGPSQVVFALYKDEQAYIDGAQPVWVKECHLDEDPEDVLSEAGFTALKQAAIGRVKEAFDMLKDATDAPFKSKVKIRKEKEAEEKAKKEEPVEETSVEPTQPETAVEETPKKKKETPSEEVAK